MKTEFRFEGKEWQRDAHAFKRWANGQAKLSLFFPKNQSSAS
jgi:hypothetical protein